MDASGIYSIAGDRAGAASLLEAVLESSPDDAMALNNLAYGRLDDGLLDEDTERMLERAFELMPSDSHILDSLGWLRYRQGRLDDGPDGFGAVSLLREAVKANGENASLEGLDHLGDALWVAGLRRRRSAPGSGRSRSGCAASIARRRSAASRATSAASSAWWCGIRGTSTRRATAR